MISSNKNKLIGVSNMTNQIKTVAICLNHRHYDGMMERILKVFPNATAVNIDGINCVACNKKV